MFTRVSLALVLALVLATSLGQQKQVVTTPETTQEDTAAQEAAREAAARAQAEAAAKAAAQEAAAMQEAIDAVAVNRIFFAFDKYDLSEDAKVILQQKPQSWFNIQLFVYLLQGTVTIVVLKNTTLHLANVVPVPPQITSFNLV